MKVPDPADMESKKSLVILLRWLLIIVTAYLILFDQEQPGALANVVVVGLVLSNLVVSSLPARVFTTRYFDHSLVVADILLVSGSILYLGNVSSDFYLIYFLIVMIAAVTNNLHTLVLGSLLAATVFLGLTFLQGGWGALLTTSTLIKVPFFFVVALFYGHLVQLVRAERTEKVAYQKELNVADQLRTLSTQLSSTLERQSVLDSLVRCVRELTRASYCSLISRGSRSIVVEHIAPDQEKPELRLGAFFPLIEKKIKERAEGNFTENQLFRVQGLTLLPLNGQLSADLYLCVKGNIEGEMFEYIHVLALQGALALKNAGQYKALLHEVEKRKILAEQLTEALEFKSHFLANISHEVRTPLCASIGFGELLLQDAYGELNPKQVKVLQRMLENEQQLLQLINNMLDISKLEAGELRLRYRVGSLDEFVSDMAETCVPLLRDKPVALKIEVDEQMPPITTDWGVLRQIAMNLVSNAVKFTLEGEVVISAGVDDVLGVFRFGVRDTGIGIPSDKFQDIFESFRQLDDAYTKRYAGTGLGLAITKKQVQLLGGKITVRSEVQVGSDFQVEIPLRSRESIETVEKVVLKQPSSSSEIHSSEKSFSPQ